MASARRRFSVTPVFENLSSNTGRERQGETEREIVREEKREIRMSSNEMILVLYMKDSIQQPQSNYRSIEMKRGRQTDTQKKERE